MPSQRESGSLTDILGPLHVQRGMEASIPIGQLPPEVPENLFNVDIDRNGRATARPGSVFYSRIGEGPILGLKEHTFESGDKHRRPVAIGVNTYDTVNTRADPSEDLAVAHGFGFCPDVSTYGTNIISFPATEDSRFHIQSFLNRLWFAGSRSDYKLRFYDYTSTQLEEVDDVRGVAVVSQGNRLFVGGDPDQPNVVFPSDPDTPETFNLNLGIQIGERNDPILALREHQGMILVLTERSAHWLLAGAIELGDVQTETISRVHGVVGSLAAAEGSDGWVYWLSQQGPVRWRRGTGSVDMEFNSAALELFETAAGDDLSSAVVYNDPVKDCVRFLIPTGDSSTPNYLMSYFHRHGGWTHGARTTSTKIASELREGIYPDTENVGLPLYTAMTYLVDRLDGAPLYIAGDEDGTIWRSKELSPEKIRALEAGHMGTDNRVQIRFGPLELSPAGYRGQIHQLLFDFLSGPQFEFDVYAEMDFSGLFNLTETCVLDIDGGELGMLLDSDDESRLINHFFHPYHVRVGLWKYGLGKVVRIQVEWDSAHSAMAFTGVEVERSLAADGEAKVQGSALTVSSGFSILEFEPDEITAGDGEGGAGEIGDPHEPGEGEEGDPVNLAVGQTGTDDGLTFTDVEDEEDLDFISNNSTGGFITRLIALDENEEFVFASRNGQVDCYDVTGIPGGITRVEGRNVVDDTDHDGGFIVGGIFYHGATNRLFVSGQGTGGSTDTSGSWALVYDVSDRGDWSVIDSFHVATFGEGGTVAGLLKVTQDARHMIFGGRAEFSGTIRDAVIVLALDESGLITEIAGTAQATPNINAAVSRMHLAFNQDETKLVTLHRNGSSESLWLNTWDISNLPTVTLIDRYDESPIGADGTPDGVAWGFGPTADRVYVQRRDEDAGLPGVQVFEEDLSTILGAFRPGTNTTTTPRTSIVPHWNGEWMYWQNGGTLYICDLLDEVTFGFLSQEATFAEGETLAIRYGPWAAGLGIDPTIPVVVDANLAVGYADGGVLVFFDFTDPAIPFMSGYVFGPWKNGHATFVNLGANIVAIGDGRLAVFEDPGGTMAKVGELLDGRLDGIEFLDYEDDTIYGLNLSNELVEIDCSDPANPTIVSEDGISVPVLPTVDLEQRGELEDHYFGYGYGTWLVDKATGEWVGSTGEPALINIQDVILDGSRAWVLSRKAGATVANVDVTSPYQQKVEAILRLSSVGDPRALVLDGTDLYVLNHAPSGTSIVSIDVSTPSTPTVQETFSATALAGATDMALSGTELWVTCGDGGDQIVRVDITDPTALSVTSNAVLQENAHGDAGATHFIAAELGGTELRAYSMGDPPALVDSLDLGGAGEIIGVSVFTSGGEKAAVAISGSGGAVAQLVIVDTDDPAGAGLSVVSTLDLGGAGLTVAGFDAANLVAVIGGDDTTTTPKRINVVDFADPSDPTLDFSDTPDWAQGPAAFAVDSGLLMVGGDNVVRGTALVDITTLSAPSLRFAIDHRWAGWDKRPFLSASKDQLFALATDPSEKIVAIDVSDPTTVRQGDGTLTGGGQDPLAFAVDYTGTVACIARLSFLAGFVVGTELEFWDITDPGAATLEATEQLTAIIVVDIRQSGADQDFVVLSKIYTGTIGLVPGLGSGVELRIYDGSAPSAPVLLGGTGTISGSFDWQSLSLW